MISYSCVVGVDELTSNIADDPLFAGQSSGNLRLSACSPCIDIGDSVLASPQLIDLADLDLDNDAGERLPFDLDLTDRFVDEPNTIDGGNADGEGVVIDMGAYERQVPECEPDIAPTNDPEKCGDGNGVINAADLGELLASWGDCPGGGDPCCADLNPLDVRDGVVNAGDLAQILAAWGPCPVECGPSFSGFGGPQGMTPEDAVVALGFQSVESFNEWAQAADSGEVYAYADLIYEILSD